MWRSTQSRRVGGLTGKGCKHCLYVVLFNFWKSQFGVQPFTAVNMSTPKFKILILSFRMDFLSLVLCSLKVSFSLAKSRYYPVSHPGLPASALGPYLVSRSPFPPEEEVFSISIERERRAPILWQLDAVEENMKQDCSVFVLPNSPPPEPVDSSIVEEPATPPPMVTIISWYILPLNNIRFKACATLQLHEE